MPPVSVAFVLATAAGSWPRPLSPTDATAPAVQRRPAQPATIEMQPWAPDEAAVLLVVVLVIAGCAQRRRRRGLDCGRSRGRGPRRSPAASTVRRDASAVTAPTLAQLIGQKLVVRMDGDHAERRPARPDPARRGRRRHPLRLEHHDPARAGRAHRRSSVRRPRRRRPAAAPDRRRPGGRPVKRIPWAPPTLSPPQMGRIASATVARAQGASTGAALHDLGIDVDFAPGRRRPRLDRLVHVHAGRTFSFNATTNGDPGGRVRDRARVKGVVPTMKHFPGLGFATRNTDAYVVTITRVEGGAGARACSPTGRRSATTSR